ncbi:MAG TPA: hypothetical protein VHN20_17530 [Beijerinckiaceae bacterium]|nr:hypothetical protein [Beijerinckiaceae bacterium]
MISGPGTAMGYSVWHWIFFALGVALVVYPTGRILARLGFSPLWAVVVFIPFFNVLGLWVLAFAEWPRDAGAP